MEGGGAGGGAGFRFYALLLLHSCCDGAAHDGL
jgi:hypothetical protein